MLTGITKIVLAIGRFIGSITLLLIGTFLSLCGLKSANISCCLSQYTYDKYQINLHVIFGMNTISEIFSEYFPVVL